MEMKKSKEADLMNKSWLFFNIGLSSTLFIVTMAFEYKVPVRTIDNWRQTAISFDETFNIPITMLPPPLPPAPQEILELQKDDIAETTKPGIDIEMTEGTQPPEIVIPSIEIPPEDPDEPFNSVEEPAAPQGGLEAFYQYVSKNLKYPPQARRMQVEGRIFVEFIVNRNGSLTDVKAIKGIGAGCDEEAVRVVGGAPQWNPGKQRGKPVRQRMVLPIYFRLN